VLRSILEKATADATVVEPIMLTKTKLVISLVATLGGGCAPPALAQYPTPRETIIYFDPTPAPLKAYTYSASVRLAPSSSRRVLQGEFRFPVFSAPPSVSVQIISSISAELMQVKTLKITEIAGSSGPVETQIVVEAETIVDAAPGGVYYANVVVTGIPVTPPAPSGSGQFMH
jgi:hypothetical protein